MSRMNWLIIGAIAVIAVVGAVIVFSVLRPPAEATRPIEAVPLATVAATTPEAAAPAPTAVAEPAMAATAAPASAAAPAPATAPASEAIFAIVPAESEVRFIIDEVLNNAPFTVVGVTDQVAGQIAVNPADPGASRVGIIRINARTLATDNEFRNRALKNRILTTDQYEFITFEPTALNGLPEVGAVGQQYSFQIVGNLTIREVTREVTFDVTLTPVTEQRLEGTAVSTVLYKDFGLTIPSVPSVASVDDDVRLELDFVAVRP